MNLVYFIEHGEYKEIIRDDKQLFQCPFCSEWFRALAYHTVQKHGVTGRTLRKMMGLKANYQLITPDLKARHREIAIENNEGEKLIRVGKDTRYKDGSIGHIDWSPQAKRELGDRTSKMMKNKYGGIQNGYIRRNKRIKSDKDEV